MTKYTICILFLLLNFSVKAQQIQTVYLIPGQGFDKRLFDSIILDEQYKIKYLEFDAPDKKISMQKFAFNLSRKIDTNECYALIGTSMGGMLSVEICEILNPAKVIVISSARNKYELPWRYRIFAKIPLYKIIPARIMYMFAKVLQPTVEPDSKNNRETFKSMLYAKTPQYIKQTSRLIITWDRTESRKNIIHIHGTKDHTLPFRNIKNPDYVIKNGSHMMTLTRGKEISPILNDILNNESCFLK